MTFKYSLDPDSLDPKLNNMSAMQQKLKFNVNIINKKKSIDDQLKSITQQLRNEEDDFKKEKLLE